MQKPVASVIQQPQAGYQVMLDMLKYFMTKTEYIIIVTLPHTDESLPLKKLSMQNKIYVTLLAQ